MVQEEFSLDPALDDVVPSEGEMESRLAEVVRLSWFLRQRMVDAGFHASFASQVANQFLWQNLGLSESGQ